MNKQESFFLGLLAGAGLMYLLDPDRGTRRLALVRDRIIHGAHELEDLGEAAGSRARDLRNRAYGVMAETRARLRHEPVDDRRLEARVRAELGRLVSDAGAIRVAAEQGRVELTGSVLPSEVGSVVAGVEGIRGVREVVNRLDAQAEPDETPDLQGATPAEVG